MSFHSCFTLDSIAPRFWTDLNKHPKKKKSVNIYLWQNHNQKNAHLFEYNMSHDCIYTIIFFSGASYCLRTHFCEAKKEIVRIFFRSFRRKARQIKHKILFNCHRLYCHHSFISSLYVLWLCGWFDSQCIIIFEIQCAEKGIANSKTMNSVDFYRLLWLLQLTIFYVPFSRNFICLPLIFFSTEFNWLRIKSMRIKSNTYKWNYFIAKCRRKQTVAKKGIQKWKKRTLNNVKFYCCFSKKGFETKTKCQKQIFQSVQTTKSQNEKRIIKTR